MGWASVRVEPEMQRMLDLLDVDDVAKTIRSEEGFVRVESAIVKTLIAT